jgi:Legionella pneumophila major outer membrane protein precursor
LGRDVVGGSADAMQLKFGVRVAELRASTNSISSQNENIPGNFTLSLDSLAPQEHRFLGAGPRLGVEGAAPMGRGWTFDYLGDVAVLLGTQNFQRMQSIQNLVVQGVVGGAAQPPPETVDKFGTVFNSDIQVGVSYWMTASAKVSLSYRLDSYFNVLYALDAQNDTTRLHRIDRYTHGPRLAVTAQF